jgi:hypothetical protein
MYLFATFLKASVLSDPKALRAYVGAAGRYDR